ncbi:MAG: hypothetical protein ACLQVJ_21630 [Syntrophobacteraceae bacterium]
MYASAQTIDFLSPFGAALGNPEMAGHQTVRAPFGAALGNPEMAGHQTVRAMAKNAFFPNWKLLVSHPGFPDGYQLIYARIENPQIDELGAS